MSAEDDIRRAQQAQRILDDPLVKEALAHLDQWVAGKFGAATPTEGLKLMEARVALDVVEQFRGFFADLVTTGRMAQERAKG